MRKFTPALLALLALARVAEAHPITEILIVTDRAHPVKAAGGARVIELDAPARLEAQLASKLPTDPNAALDVIQRRFAAVEAQRRWREAYRGVIDAFNLRVSQIPAVIVDRRYVVYGTSELALALSLIEQFRSKE